MSKSFFSLMLIFAKNLTQEIMAILKPILLISEAAKRVDSGKSSDVDYFMSYLDTKTPIATIKLIDFALSQIRSQEGVKQIEYYLFNGTKIQRSYAALYLKRHGFDDVLLEALIQKCIDEKQAFSI